MKQVLIITLIVVAMIGIMIPNVDAYWVNGVEYKSPGYVPPAISEPVAFEDNTADPNAYGKIILSENEFKLYRGTVISFPIFIEMNDYVHNPTLNIFYDDVLTKVTYPKSNGDIFQSVIGLNDNWKSGTYEIKLIHNNKILDSYSFVIKRDNETFLENIVDKNMFEYVDAYILSSPSKISVDSYSHEIISITGSTGDSINRNLIALDILTPDKNIISSSTSPTSDGFFSHKIMVDKHWISGEYVVTGKYLNRALISTTFVVENIWKEFVPTESNLVGAFDITSEISNNFTILSVDGTIETDASEMILSISKGDDILYQDTLPLNEKSFETSTVLYDYDNNIPWEYGEYQITGMVGEQSFHSEKFILDGVSFSGLELLSMNLFANMGSGVEKMVDFTEIEINSGDEKQIILSGNIGDYLRTELLDVHLIHPDGTDEISYLHGSSDGSYYMPINIDDTWASGSYTAYVQFREFTDDASTFKIINNALKDSEIVLQEENIEISLEDIKNYSISLDNSQSVDSVHYVTTMDYYSTKTPIVISLNGELLKEEFTYVSDKGLIDYYLLLDKTWISGNYTASYVENNVSIPFGTFEIFNNYIVEDVVQDVVLEELIDEPLTLGQSLFKSSSHVVEYLQFSGKLVDDSTKNVSISLDGELQSVVSLDSEGNYAGVISMGDNLDSGFHNLSMSSGDMVESVEFLIATNHYIPLKGDLEIFRNDIIESGGEISVFLTQMVPNFVPSEVQYVTIIVEGDDFYERFSVMPKGYGFYSQNFMLDETLGSYDVTVKYGEKIIESYNIDVLAIDPQWLREHTESWVYGKISDYSYFQKLVLTLDDDYTVTANVSAPDWFVESAAMWMRGMLDDDSFNDSIKFLAENRLL